MHVHILGICGTFMGGIASIAKELGYTVTGADENVYPPMSTQLTDLGIQLIQGYDLKQFFPKPDCVIIGNAMRRGNPAVEYVLNQGIPYYSGPEWLYQYILQDKWVLAVAGTHGKTTTTGMLAWILEYANLSPGFLIGGVPGNFTVSARLGGTPFFVIEADEYDTAFFDKRSKFLHYRPRTLIMNNLEFDHADIFDDLSQIKQQFHHLVRTVPGEGLIIYPAQDKNLQDVLAKGCWSAQSTFAEDGLWYAVKKTDDNSRFAVFYEGKHQGTIQWSLVGEHNQQNALAAIVAAWHVGVPPHVSVDALNQFINAKRRLEMKGVVNGMTIYDDFAHHPTAIRYTLSALRHKVGEAKIIAVLEFGSFTMKKGVHQATIMQAFEAADEVVLKSIPSAEWDVRSLLLTKTAQPCFVYDTVAEIIQHLKQRGRAGDQVLIMSNKGFDGLYDQLV